jgi:methylated-DNA-[protein]-cysteine S-methyltransferase
MKDHERKFYLGRVSSTPLGTIWVAVSEKGLVAVEISDQMGSLVEMLKRGGATFIQVDQEKTSNEVQQISEYLQGERETFDLSIDWSELTPFQVRALQATIEIPFGQVKTYGEIAAQLGNPRAARAVGRAEATNPMPLVIPCHRVIGADGGLHGYGAGRGLETKAWLLKLEEQS